MEKLFSNSIEIWKKLEEYPCYEISTMGRLKSIKTNKILKPLKYGLYLGYTITHIHPRKREYAHRLVAITFLGNPKGPQYTVNHKNGNKYDNSVENLEWCTLSDNLKHAYRIGLRTAPCAQLGKFGKLHHMSKPIYQFNIEGIYVNKYGSICEAGRETGICSLGISRCANNTKYCNSAGGYRWSFEPHIEGSIKYIEHKTRPIYQFTLDGNIITKYNSITDAAKSINGLFSNIYSAAKGVLKTSYGFKWSFTPYL